MRTAEASGKTLEEAQEAALRELGVSADQVTFEVIEEPRKLLGFLANAGDYRVRAVLREEGDEPAAAAAESVATPASEGEMVESAAKAGRSQELAARRAQEFLAETTRLMGLETEVVITDAEPDAITLEIQGQSLGLLIGRHGATLDALQLLAAVVANSGMEGGARIVVDAEDYRERRREMLRKMAVTHAEKAKRRGQEVVIPDLKPFERRVIHLTLRDDPEVETYSEGEGENRCLVISPKVPTE